MVISIGILYYWVCLASSFSMWGPAGLYICVRVLKWGVGSLCAVFSNNVFLVKMLLNALVCI